MTTIPRAYAAFSIVQPVGQNVHASFNDDGSLVIKQGGDIVLLRSDAIAAFKRAVAQLGIIV